MAPTAPATSPEEGAIRELFVRGQAAWPNLKVTEARFHRFILHQQAKQARPLDVTGLHAEDLFLACGCLHAEPDALRAFHALYRDDIRALLGRMGNNAAAIRDIEQSVWIRLFVAEAPKLPKIGEYSGRGSLRAWVRTVTSRVALEDLEKSRSRTRTLEEALLVTLSPMAPDVEMQHSQRVYRDRVQTAFTAAIEGLPVRDRNLIRQYFLDGLSIDQLAALYAMHRATVARQIHRARARILAQTRDLLGNELQAGGATVDSIMRLIDSMIDLP